MNGLGEAAASALLLESNRRFHNEKGGPQSERRGVPGNILERFGSGGTSLCGVSTKDFAEPFDRAVDRGIDVRSCDSYTGGA